MRTDDTRAGGDRVAQEIRWGLALVLLTVVLAPANILIEAVVPAFLAPTENTLWDDLPQLAFNTMLAVIALVGMGKIALATLTSGRAHPWPLVEDVKEVLGLHTTPTVAVLPVKRAGLIQARRVEAVSRDEPAMVMAYEGPGVPEAARPDVTVERGDGGA